MIIREYSDTTDREQTIALWKTVFGYTANHNEPGLAIDKKIEVDNLFWVAEEDGTVIGTVMAGYDGHRGWIYSMAVHPEKQGGGAGSKLLRHAEQRLAELGCIKLNLQVVEGNDVLEFYRANGFAVEARISMGKRLKG